MWKAFVSDLGPNVFRASGIWSVCAEKDRSNATDNGEDSASELASEDMASPVCSDSDGDDEPSDPPPAQPLPPHSDRDLDSPALPDLAPPPIPGDEDAPPDIPRHPLPNDAVWWLPNGAKLVAYKCGAFQCHCPHADHGDYLAQPGVAISGIKLIFA